MVIMILHLPLVILYLFVSFEFNNKVNVEMQTILIFQSFILTDVSTFTMIPAWLVESVTGEVASLSLQTLNNVDGRTSKSPSH